MTSRSRTCCAIAFAGIVAVVPMIGAAPVAADDCKVTAPVITPSFSTGGRAPTFTWTASCRGSIETFWSFYVGDVRTYEGRSGFLPGDSFTPPMPDDPGITRVSFSAFNQRFNDNGTRADGQTGNVEVVLPVLAPSAPSDLQVVDIGDRQLAVSWRESTAPGGPELSYVVSTKPAGGQCTVVWATSCVLSGLRYGTTYSVTVTARNAGGASPAVSARPVTLRAPAPTAPRGVVAEVVSRTTAEVTWLPPLDSALEKVSDYVVTAAPGQRTCRTRTLSCRIDGLTAGTRYTFTVTASRGSTKGSSATSAPVTMPAPPPPPTPPALPPQAVSPGKPPQTIT